MSFFTKSLIKLVLALIIMFGGSFYAGRLAVEIHGAFLFLAVLIFFIGTLYIVECLRCPKCGAHLFMIFSWSGLLVTPWFSTKCHKCGKDFLKNEDDEVGSE